MVRPPATQSINLQHSFPDSDPKLTHMKAARRKGQEQVAPVPFLNPDPIACLVGLSNEAPVVIDGQEITALIDLGSSGVEHKCSVLLRAHPAHPAPGSVIEARGDGGCSHPIPWICGGKPPDSGDKKYNEDVLLLVIPTTTYSKTVPVVVGTNN